MGRGNGQGERDEEADNTRTFGTRVKQQLRPGGKVEVTGLVSGKQIKGESILLGGETLEADAAAASDALNRQNIPREYRKHAREYFERVGNPGP